jgi:hypothetical protein
VLWESIPHTLKYRAMGIHKIPHTHGHVVGVDYPLGSKEGQDHLLGPAGWDLGLDGARLAL